MACTYGGLPCLDPAQELRNCQRLGFPTPWYGLANGFVCPQGPGPGRGFVLMLRGDLLSLNLNAFYPLVFHDGSRVVTLKNILFMRAYCATPGARGGSTQAYWCELADRRELVRRVPIDRAYNVRSSPGGAFLSATMNGASPWAWAEMVQHIWVTIGKMGTWPGLPFTPDGTPEGWLFYASYGLDALSQVLDRLGCALDYDPVRDVFSIVRIGITDGNAAGAITAVDPVCVWDSNPIESTKGRVPSVVRVVFAKQLTRPDTTGASPYLTQDVADPTPGGPLPGTEPGTAIMVSDDLPALYDGSGTLTNSAALTSRAQERAADYFRRIRQTRFYRSYSGGFAAPGLLPGSQLTATIWRDAGHGLFTEVVRLPTDQGDAPFAALPGPNAAGGQPPADGGSTLQTVPGLGSIPVPGYQGPVLLGMRLPQLPFYSQDYSAVPSGASLRTAALFGQGVFGCCGLLLYKDGVGLKGPEPILEVIDGSGITNTIADDPADGRVQLTIKWNGLTLQAGGSNYGPERILEVIPGAGIVITAADDAANNRTQLTITNGDPGSGGGATGDHKVAVSSGDTTPNYLQPKLVAGAGISIVQENAGANEDLKITNTDKGSDFTTTGSVFTSTTTDSFVTVFDSVNAQGLIGGVALKNTGGTGHSLTYQITVEDMFTTTVTGAATGLSPGSTINWSLLSSVGISGVFFPFREFKLQVKSGVAGQSTTYECWEVLAN